MSNWDNDAYYDDDTWYQAVTYDQTNYQDVDAYLQPEPAGSGDYPQPEASAGEYPQAEAGAGSAPAGLADGRLADDDPGWDQYAGYDEFGYLASLPDSPASLGSPVSLDSLDSPISPDSSPLPDSPISPDSSPLPISPISPAEPAPWLPPPPDQDWTPQAASWQPPAAGEPWAPETAPTVVDSWAPDSGPWQPVPAAEPWEAGEGEPYGVSRSPLAVRRPRWLLVGISAVAAAALGFSVVMLTHRGNPSLPSSVLPTSTARPASGGGAPASPATAMATQAPLTPSQAQQVLAAYTTANNSANAQASQTLLATVEGGSSLAIDSGIYDAQRAAHAAGYPAYSPAAASYYIPLESPAAYPHWFAVRVSNSLLSAPGKVTQMEYLVFTQAAAGAPWLDSMEPFTLPSATAPSVALDASGHATAVSATGTSLALPAATAGVATATALDSGAGQPASPGNLAEASELASLRQTVPSHPSITSSHSATTDPVFGLRTTDGGALLFYDVAARLTVTAAPGGTLHLNIPGFVSPANPASQVTLQYLDQLAVSDPPAGGGMPVQVIADYSGLTAAAG